ncbi:Retrovirus-related Pol polyprotein from transposon TNT 1-94 [Cucumis melo var. makuwa]|uniref:Retrovirus-related Pol polyprotein from transposon TNT 1-94 n=1 Tax=Cucumis melo var. makuwa TaxID=1194695 RepID=A0A5A7U8L8_CUCMM|nr:Retrovirus-related Pol polyprotein from transposon TNT 1-94 [Cucumis melo var. makuwa]TYK01827.1 Retrovirus-related Pol polyprotein from transposon TNT 1-94 [Cucumis melo var. makuwa]
MGLRPEYESVKAALLHRSPLPSLDAAIQAILFEEKRLGINLSKHSDVVLASTYSSPGASSTFCKNCKLTGHKFIDCPKIECRYCHKPGHILDNCPIKPPRPRSYSTRAKNFTKPRNSSVVAATLDNPTTPSNRWLLNSTCCNHMTSNYSLMNTPSLAKSLPPIYAADDNCMNITHIGIVNTPSMNLPHTYCVPNLTFNLVSVGQLCDLGLTVSFSPNGCQVQDPQTGQTIGTGRKVGRLFELLSLQVPFPSSISAPVTNSDTYQWHLRLGHASPEKLRHLISINHLNSTTKFRSCPHTSQQNGRAERKHRHILDSVRALLLSASCPEKFWGVAALTSIYIINRLPSYVLQNISPFEKIYGTPPNYSNLKTFGCAYFVLLHPHEHTKLEPRARLCCFLGYGTEHKGFRCSDLLSNRLRISRHVTFWEHTMFSRLSSFHTSFSSPQPFFTNTSIDLFPPSESPLGNELAQSAPTSTILDQSSISDGRPEPTSDTPPRRSTWVREPPIHLQDYHCFSTIISLVEPTSYQEASTDPLWQKAMNDELQALEKTHTWDYVDLPPGKRLIGCKWIYKIKTHSDGTIERYKTRLVAKGYSQEYGIDYEETFAPVARMTSVRSLLVVAAAKQ